MGQVTHLATAATAATTALNHLSLHPPALAALAAHPLTAPALSYMLEEHSYVRLKLLFPGLLQSERPRSARAALSPSVNGGGGAARVEYNPAVHRGGRERPGSRAARPAPWAEEEEEAGAAEGAEGGEEEEDVREAAAAVVARVAATVHGAGANPNPS